MGIHIALLRGINVGGKNLLPMKELVALLEGLGLDQVATYIRSGNVVFRHRDTKPSGLADQIQAAIESSHGFTPQVLLLSRDELEQAVAANPYPEAEVSPKSLHLFFLASAPRNPNLETLDGLKRGGERFELRGKIFYLHAPAGIGRSKLAQRVERLLGVAGTGRNWRTVCKILEMVASEVAFRVRVRSKIKSPLNRPNPRDQPARHSSTTAKERYTIEEIRNLVFSCAYEPKRSESWAVTEFPVSSSPRHVGFSRWDRRSPSLRRRATRPRPAPASEWFLGTVDATREVGYSVSVAVDPETRDTYISYYEGDDGDLWLARTGAPNGNCGPDNTWYCQALDIEGVVGKFSSIAVGGPGTYASLYISYNSITDGRLKVIQGTVNRQTGDLVYDVHTIDDGVGGTAVALAATGVPQSPMSSR